MLGKTVPVRNVILSTYDKTGLVDFASGLREYSAELRLFTTGGTYRVLDEAFGGTDVVQRISDYTGRPELQGGLVKTLDYALYLGLLADPLNPAHAADMERVGAAPFDMVVVNLYPFTEAVARDPDSIETARDFIDIGGPTMLRAAAKSFYRIAAVSDPGDYDRVLRVVAEHGGTTPELRYELAQKVFALTAAYDTSIRDHLARSAGGPDSGRHDG
jgi:phosphoribosylaminoimidazolecarboxamide formyltransferase/IMP cyclohydrolase